ncbi:hypothetical protein IJI17_03075 [Candidatus Saccharibacteria bacterium]|nr:hypothetical protein [Candidatus Saccharibacteria bacterium]MBQ6321172.1 hypothetical protein [Candidatus Saccharibacteria bacterium]
MNKDVIYIEPEDDITDIITKIENAKEKIVALVLPKKSAVLRSVVNIKLIHKAGFTADKTVVLVTDDPAVVKLAGTVKMPVTKDLKSAPNIPDVFEVETESKEEMVVEPGEEADVEANADGGEKVSEEAAKSQTEAKKVAEAEAEVAAEELVAVEATADGKKPAKQQGEKKPSKLDNIPAFKWMREHKKISIGAGIGAVVLILVLVWAFAIAPAVTITVGVRTTKSNFSENVTFTEKLEDEDTSTGKFYLEEKKIENKTEVEFEATGEKNIGEKASGKLLIYAYFKSKETINVAAGSTFTTNGLTYVSSAAASLSWDGTTMSLCDNINDTSIMNGTGCRISKQIDVVATEGGSKYNLNSDTTNWKTNANVMVATANAITGGTDKIVTVVQQSDVDAALLEIKSENSSSNKELLLDELTDGDFPIEASFKQTTSDPVVSPAVGEQVEDGKNAVVTVVVTDSLYVIDETKVKEYIAEKAKLADNFKIYDMNDPFIENFTKTDSGYVGKLKTSYTSGPRVTENDITELARGKGLGEASKDISSAFDGISEVHIDPSFPWVYTVPNDTNKITVIINVKES